MPIPSRIESYLARHAARYDLVPHAASHTSIETAELAHVHMTASQFFSLLGPAERAHFAQQERRTHR
jgi:hypothetical protein